MAEPRTPYPGRLFVFEGIDGSGKTTQRRRVAEALRARNFPVVELFEPTDGPWGRKIRQAARRNGERLTAEEEIDLFVRDRMENVARHIRPALERGDVVLLDRYYFSTMAYQGARGVDPEAIRDRNEAFAPRPDLVLLYALPIDAALERIRRARGGATDWFERREDLERVAALFEQFARRFDFFRRIDATLDEKTITAETLCAIEAALPRPPGPPPRRISS